MLSIQEIGNRLKALRQKAGLSQEELAEQCETSQNIISRMELGEGGSLKMLLTMINFYKSKFNMDGFLSDHFSPDTILESGSSNTYRSIAQERLRSLLERKERADEQELRDLKDLLHLLETVSVV
ncbi:transcriptional regulator [Paraflavisolibacter sp. H34]|uniref:helix-turn-helix domain-containing protein n=1 Tax=Huijunlia imazamoxiresistens TaxID=3127457 RepID=UPI003015FE1D